MGVLDGSKERGADVRVWEYDDTSAQKWRIQQNDDGSYRIKAKCSGLSLDVSGGKFEKKTNVQQWDNHNDKPEKWMFVLYDENLYFIVNVQNSVNMRGKPSTDSAILAEVPKGEEVRYTGDQVDDFIGVEYNGQKGYILSKYLSHSK